MSNKIQLGCRVYVKSKSQNKYYGPFRVIDIEGDYVKIAGILSGKIYGVRNDTLTIRDEDTLTRAVHNSVRGAFPKLINDILPDDMEKETENEITEEGTIDDKLTVDIPDTDEEIDNDAITDTEDEEEVEKTGEED